VLDNRTWQFGIRIVCCRQCNQDIEDNPDNAKAYLNRAICYMHLRNYEETLNDAMQSTKLNDARYTFADKAHMLPGILECSMQSL
jgi:tetratricopeptide (TPR) repeat protein